MQDFAEQLAALQPLLLRVARKRLRNRAWADDAVSETLVAALEKPDAFAGRSTLKSWLMGILMHQTVNQIRLHTRECQVTTFDDQSDSDWIDGAAVDIAGEARAQLNDPQESLHQRQFMTRVDRCLRSLPVKQARAFLLRHGQEEDTGDICAELGVTSTHLHVMLHRARCHLRTAMSAP